jgi:uncharacterized integral membrane protein
MSKHHHHPHEGHSAGNAPGTGRKAMRHSWFFWIAGVFILLALLGFILSNNLTMQPAPAPRPPATPAGVDK